MFWSLLGNFELSAKQNNQSVLDFTDEDILIEQHMNGYYLRFFPHKKLTLEEAQQLKSQITDRRERLG